VDHTTTTSSPLTFAHARNLAEHSRRESVRDAGTAVLVAGAEGFYEFASSATAQASLGWRAEVGVDAGQLNTKTAVAAVARVTCRRPRPAPRSTPLRSSSAPAHPSR
jgi:hypothetical protein